MSLSVVEALKLPFFQLNGKSSFPLHNLSVLLNCRKAERGTKTTLNTATTQLLKLSPIHSLAQPFKANILSLNYLLSSCYPLTGFSSKFISIKVNKNLHIIIYLRRELVFGKKECERVPGVWLLSPFSFHLSGLKVARKFYLV